MSLQFFNTIIDDGRRELLDLDMLSLSAAPTVIGSIVQLLLRELSRPYKRKRPRILFSTLCTSLSDLISARGRRLRRSSSLAPIPQDRQ